MPASPCTHAHTHTEHIYLKLSCVNCSTLGAFRKANIACMLAIQKSNKEELLGDESEETSVRHR